MTLSLYARRSEAERDGRCVLEHMPAVSRDECPCWPCRVERSRQEREQRRQERIARFRALLRLRVP